MRWFRRREEPAKLLAAVDHALIVSFDLAGEQATDEELDLVHELAEHLESSIANAGVGEYDGDGFGGGECELFMYGPDADALYRAVEPVLRDSR